MIDINFTEKHYEEYQVTCVFLDDNKRISPVAALCNDRSDSIISKFLSSSKDFTGKFGDIKILTFPGEKYNLNYLILVGIGKVQDITENNLQTLGSTIYNAIKSIKAENVFVESFHSSEHENKSAQIAFGLLLSSYSFEKYHTKKKPEEIYNIESIDFHVHDKASAEFYFSPLKEITEGVFLARNLVSEPGNILYPESYANYIAEELEQFDVDIEVFGENEMKNMGMNALLGVGQGSARESKMVVMSYYGAEDRNQKPLAFIGKGVTFDTGGISIKPSANMGDMKYDMAGSAAVVGAMRAIAGRKAKVNVIGVVGLVENMPGGNAQRPGDVVVSMSGQTIEILNTDAEGRLVLADVLWYTQDRFKPEFMIDLATLTGAIIVSLGNKYAGLFSNNDDLSNKILSSGKLVSEELWRMPLCSEYDKMINSDIADMANIGSPGGSAGSATAAQFLQRFVNDIPWAHLDIAGCAWERKGKSVYPKGATGYGVMLLDKLVNEYYEKN